MLRHEDHSDRGRSASLIDFTEFSSSGGASVSLRFKLIQAHGLVTSSYCFQLHSIYVNVLFFKLIKSNFLSSLQIITKCLFIYVKCCNRW